MFLGGTRGEGYGHERGWREESMRFLLKGKGGALEHRCWFM